MNPSNNFVRISKFPDEIERHVFHLASTMDRRLQAGSIFRYMLVAKRVRRWLEPVLYEAVDLYCQHTAELFISSLQSRQAFASTAIKVLHLRPSVTPEQGARILELCPRVQELTLKIITDLPDARNPLRTPLNSLCELTTLSLDMASAFYGPTISLADLPVLHRIKRLDLANGWVVMRGLHVGISRLQQLTHISLLVQQLGERIIHTEILAYILRFFRGLQVMILWRMQHRESRVIYDYLVEEGIRPDRRVVVFNAARFAECVQHVDGIWRSAETVVRWREERDCDFVLPTAGQFPELPL